MNLLIVEDEPELSKSIATYFHQNKFTCDTALDFLSASNKMSECEYACIILDISLPGGSGLELLRWLKKSSKDEGVLIISAKNSLDDKVEGLELTSLPALILSKEEAPLLESIYVSLNTLPTWAKNAHL